MRIDEIITLRKRLVIAMLCNVDVQRDCGVYRIPKTDLRRALGLRKPQGPHPATLAKLKWVALMRDCGLPWREIAKLYGVKMQTAWRWYRLLRDL